VGGAAATRKNSYQPHSGAVKMKVYIMETRQTSDGVRVVKPGQFDSNTPQTPGMQRVAAVSQELAGSAGIWAGVTVVDPHIASGCHHHGALETVIYVVSGHGRIRWWVDNRMYEEDVEPGDFIYVPPFVPHQEINPADTPSRWVIVRNAQEPIVVNLDPVGDPAQQAANDATHGKSN
jgi:uncharacterized RmlC-like cupin family protein